MKQLTYVHNTLLNHSVPNFGGRDKWCFMNLCVEVRLIQHNKQQMVMTLLALSGMYVYPGTSTISLPTNTSHKMCQLFLRQQIVSQQRMSAHSTSKKFCQQILSSKTHNQTSSTNGVSSNKIDKSSINKFCQQILSTNPDNQLCRTEQPAQHKPEMFLVFKKSDWCKLRSVNSQSAAKLTRMHRGGHGSGR